MQEVEREEPRPLGPCASMAAKLNPNTLYVREPERADAGDESSDSDGEPEESSHKLIRKVSTSGQIRAKVGHCAPLYTYWTERGGKNRNPEFSAVG